MPIIKNPVLSSENFNRHWNQHKYSNFRDKIKLFTDKVNEAFNIEDHDESVKKWREVFGDEFGKLKDNDKNNKSFTRENISRNNKPWFWR